MKLPFGETHWSDIKHPQDENWDGEGEEGEEEEEEEGGGVCVTARRHQGFEEKRANAEAVLTEERDLQLSRAAFRLPEGKMEDAKLL